MIPVRSYSVRMKRKNIATEASFKSRQRRAAGHPVATCKSNSSPAVPTATEAEKDATVHRRTLSATTYRARPTIAKKERSASIAATEELKKKPVLPPPKRPLAKTSSNFLQVPIAPPGGSFSQPDLIDGTADGDDQAEDEFDEHQVRNTADSHHRISVTSSTGDEQLELDEASLPPPSPARGSPTVSSYRKLAHTGGSDVESMGGHTVGDTTTGTTTQTTDHKFYPQLTAVVVNDGQSMQPPPVPPIRIRDHSQSHYHPPLTRTGRRERAGSPMPPPLLGSEFKEWPAPVCDDDEDSSPPIIGHRKRRSIIDDLDPDQEVPLIPRSPPPSPAVLFFHTSTAKVIGDHVPKSAAFRAFAANEAEGQRLAAEAANDAYHLHYHNQQHHYQDQQSQHYDDGGPSDESDIDRVGVSFAEKLVSYAPPPSPSTIAAGRRRAVAGAGDRLTRIALGSLRGSLKERQRRAGDYHYLSAGAMAAASGVGTSGDSPYSIRKRASQRRSMRR